MAPGLIRLFLEGKRYPTDLILVIIYSFISAGCVVLSGECSPIRVILGLPLLIFLPGYALVAMIWPAKKGLGTSSGKHIRLMSGGLDTVERLILSLGLSIVLVCFAGIVLNYTSSITVMPILISLLGLTLVFSSAAWYLRKSLPVQDRFSISFMINSEGGAARPQSEKLLTAGIMICIIATVIILLYLIANPASGPYTEYILLDGNRMFDNLPDVLSTNQTGNVFVSVVNHEKTQVNYSLVATIANTTGPTVVDPPSPVVLNGYGTAITNLVLDNDESYEQAYTIRFSNEGRYRVTWELLIEGQPTDYALHLWIDVI
jgi:uncharacterized membrane protein